MRAPCRLLHRSRHWSPADSVVLVSYARGLLCGKAGAAHLLSWRSLPCASALDAQRSSNISSSSACAAPRQ